MMNILLVNVPSRKGKGGFMIPLGLLYAGGIIERCGHKARIFDPYLYDLENEEIWQKNLESVIDAFQPEIIGFGGIATSYGRTKIISNHLRIKYPEIYQIAGGALSSVSDLLLMKTGVQTVFHGETEASLPQFLRFYGQGSFLEKVPGISYRTDTQVITAPLAAQIEDLDTIPFPAYHLVEMGRYFGDITSYFTIYEAMLERNQPSKYVLERIGKRRRHIPVVTSRGCSHRCLFCYRHMKGHRQHTVSYVIKHLKFLKDRYGLEGFQFCDELFNASRSWVMEFCEAIEKEKLDIFYLVSGARVDRIDEQMLTRLKETGCVEICYGQESGSNTILKEYRKGVSSVQNKEITLLTTNKVGIPSTVQLVIGSPGETGQTIGETIQFLKDVEAYQCSLNYLIPLPGTPIWRYVLDKEYIVNVEDYLDLVAEHGGTPLLNLTQIPDKIWRRWHYDIRREFELYNCRRGNKTLLYVYNLLFLSILPYIPQRLKFLLKRLIKLTDREKKQ